MGTKAVVLGLSGGVDSAVAARLLLAAGYTVYGHWLDIGLGGREDAQSVAEALGIPFSTGDIRGALEREVMAPFQADYLAGRTPLPCARCNPTVKFPALFRRAEEVGAPFVATGHYARIRPGADGAPTLCRGAHANDQAYLLARLPRGWLGRLIFPLGDYAKPQVRQLARAFGLPLALIAWQLDGQGRLAQAPLPPQAQGGLMLVGANQPIQGGADPRRAAQEILAQCRSRACAGVILDLELPPSPFLAQLIRLVEEGLAQRQSTLFLPERYANFSRRASLYLTSAISGGSLRRRLEEVIAQYGARRLVLCLRRAREDFFLPATKGGAPHLPGGTQSAAAAVGAVGLFLPPPLRPVLHLHEPGDRRPLRPLRRPRDPGKEADPGPGAGDPAVLSPLPGDRRPLGRPAPGGLTERAPDIGCFPRKNPVRLGSDRVFEQSIILFTVLPGRLRLLAALHAGALIVLSSPHFRQDARLGAAALEPFQSAFQRLILPHMDFRHSFSLPPKWWTRTPRTKGPS